MTPLTTYRDQACKYFRDMAPASPSSHLLRSCWPVCAQESTSMLTVLPNSVFNPLCLSPRILPKDEKIMRGPHRRPMAPTGFFVSSPAPRLCTSTTAKTLSNTLGHYLRTTCEVCAFSPGVDTGTGTVRVRPVFILRPWCPSFANPWDLGFGQC